MHEYGAAQCFATFIMFTMPANILTNLLLFGRTPTILMNAVAIPSHLACFAVLELGGGSLMPILSGAYVLTFIDSFGVLDNVTTAFNYMEEGFETTGAPIYCVLIGMMVNLAGGLVRHFAANGFAGGSKTFDAKLGGALLYSLAACSTYYWFAIKRCDDLAAARAGGRSSTLRPSSATAATRLTCTRRCRCSPSRAPSSRSTSSRRARRRRRRGAGCDTGLHTHTEIYICITTAEAEPPGQRGR